MTCRSSFVTTLLVGLVATLGAAAPARAARVGVAVTDGAGKPLADAVVTLEPVVGKLAVKPLAGVQIAQIARQFSPQLTIVTVGTAVGFPNQDTTRHHVYSFSPVKTFELKLYAGAAHAPIVFDKPGVAVLGCNIHDQMAAWIVVVDTPFYARSAASGRAEIDGVPAGAYRLRVWHASLSGAAEPPTSPLTVAAADVEQRVRLDGARSAP